MPNIKAHGSMWKHGEDGTLDVTTVVGDRHLRVGDTQQFEPTLEPPE